MNVSTVSSGSQLPVALNAFSPASTSFHSIFLPKFAAAASITSCAAGQMSTPVPSPSMYGMMGSSGTCSRPSVSVIFSGINLLLLVRGRLIVPAREEGQSVEGPVDGGHSGTDATTTRTTR